MISKCLPKSRGSNRYQYYCMSSWNYISSVMTFV